MNLTISIILNWYSKKSASNTKNDRKNKFLIFGDRFPFTYFTEEYDLDYVAAFDGCISLPLISDQHPTEQTTEGAYFPELVETVGFTFNNCTNLLSVTNINENVIYIAF